MHVAFLKCQCSTLNRQSGRQLLQELNDLAELDAWYLQTVHEVDQYHLLAPQLQKPVAQLCQAWWQADDASKQLLMPQT